MGAAVRRRGPGLRPLLSLLSPIPPLSPPLALLAVDLGVRTGLALYDRGGRLVGYRSQNLGTRARLARAAPALLDVHPSLERLVLEGGGDLAEVWAREGARRGLDVRVIDAETWRRALLLPREQRTGADAKRHADGLARAVIAWSGAPAPKGPLRHDAAEAVCAGLYGVLEAGWLPALPAALRR